MTLRLKLRARRDKPSPDAMTLTEHIAELRTRVIIAVLAFFVASVVAFILYPHILSFLKHPYCKVTGPAHCQLYITSPLDGLSLRVKIAAYGGLFLSLPVILWELWRFITPGLHRNERKYTLSFVAASLVLFFAGVVVAYVVFAHALQFLGTVGGPSLHEIYDPINYLGLMVALMLVFGLTFEFPVLLVSLELVGAVTPAKLSSWRRWAIVLITLFAAIIVPSGDPFSMAALAVPMYIFYEVSIVVGKLLRR
jgi:sec-independent protein translocase protein TatC